MANANRLNLGPRQTTPPSAKEAEREQIRQDIEAFIANGGVIEKLVTPPMRPLHTEPDDTV